MKIWAMTFVAWDTYSWNGVSQNDIKLFVSEERAKQYAISEGLTIVYQAEHPKQVELEEMLVIE